MALREKGNKYGTETLLSSLWLLLLLFLNRPDDGRIDPAMFIHVASARRVRERERERKKSPFD